ncbi:hypothetical protein HPB51_026387 [Rhipicephalus microplus]|uniref:MADF domain-containing protein n=1 Tax=Rhipicephalus microplus TaxID=6941 RepID=A0A9J6D378_RHIMP|nr:hypothetical protein HPB51_026387 [Rhipicephalus microplus]
MDYRDAERKCNAWEQIRVYSGLSKVDECLKLWKRLRDRYTRELKAIEETKRSGSGYVSRRAWEFTESMAFYKHCGRQRKMTGSLEPATYGDDGETAESIFATMGNTPPSPSGVESPMDSLQELSMPATSPPLAERPPETGKQEAAPKHKKGKKNDNFEEQLLCKLDSKMGENEPLEYPLPQLRQHATMTCSLEPATYGDDGETAESIFATMGNTPPSPSGVESPMDSLQELSMPATSPPLAERPPETGKQEAAPKHKKGKKNDNFEEQLLCKLDSKMGENEAFGISIGLSLDNMPRKVALKCKARIMTLIAEMEEENDVHTINIS